MLGTVFAMLNSSAWSPLPSAATSSADRTKPLRRDTVVPAAITDFSNPAAMQALRRAALFRNDDSPLPLAPNVSAASIRIEYLWQNVEVTPVPAEVKDLADLPAFGMWRDRTDLPQDGAEASNELRRRMMRRGAPSACVMSPQ